MSDDHFNYDQLMLEAHQGLIRRVLSKVAQSGLPGEHHFFIIFSTIHSGTRISDRLRIQYPAEMTIVLQHQYSNLNVFEDRFEIQLSFNRIPELLVIPFAAITGFVDPSVPFGLQLAGDPAAGLENSIGMLVPGLPKTTQKETPEPDGPSTVETEATFEAVVELREQKDETTVPSIFSHPTKHDKAKIASVPDTNEAEEEKEEKEPTATVLQLDAFRKKSK
jgi:hypothetical protein